MIGYASKSAALIIRGSVFETKTVILIVSQLAKCLEDLLSLAKPANIKKLLHFDGDFPTFALLSQHCQSCRNQQARRDEQTDAAKYLASQIIAIHSLY